MTRPAWLETVAGICGGEPGEWVTSDGMAWASPHDDNGGAWLADYDSVAYCGAVRIRVWRVDGEVDHARLANAVQAARAVECGDLDVDALQQRVATLTRERDELAAGPDWRELHALRSFASRVLIDGGVLSLLLAGVLAWRVVADLRVEVVRHERGAPVEARR